MFGRQQAQTPAQSRQPAQIAQIAPIATPAARGASAHTACRSLRKRQPYPLYTLRPVSLALLAFFAGSALALPSDPALIAGQATVSRTGPTQLVINQSSAKAALDWRSFNVGANEAVRFNQPSASALTVNRVTGNDPSQILGRISAPGSVFLINPAGVYFGASAVVHVGNLIAGTLSAQPLDLLNGRLSFSRTSGSAASVRNDGRLETPIGGSVSLLGSEVINAGSISTPGGTTGLIAGDRIVVDFHGDGLVRYQVDAAAARALVSNPGRIDADGGRIALQASARDALVDTVLNVEGIVRARGARQHNGEIYLDGGSSGVVSVSGQLDAASREPAAAGGQISVLGDKVGIFGSAQLDASGDAGGGRILIGGDYQGKGSVRTAQQTYVGKDATITADALSTGQGGKIIVWADDWTRFSGSISARGGQQHGDGGFVEVSGKQNLGFDGHVDTSAPHGSVGSLLLDPSDLYVGGTAPEGATVLTSTSFKAPPDNVPDGSFFVAAGSLASNTDYTLQATQDVIFNQASVTFGSGTGKTVSVTADRHIKGNGSTAPGINTRGGNLSLKAGTATASGSITVGSITVGSIDIGSGTLTVDLVNASGTMNQTAGITAGALEKKGLGTLTLGGTNIYSGGTTISGGVLAVTQPDSLASGSQLVINGGSLEISGDITLNTLQSFKMQGAGASGGGALRLASGKTGGYAGPITLTGSTTVSAASGSVLTLAGAITQDPSASNPGFSLTKVG
ncbi:MAG: filamentous hemagglutinin N-terminal domain-containing protein, partial [Candidatus Accumulibacter sp.]|uniref:two-partner secretion domain-containing protein n=1 Tax=Accumulibacter sp. TaxID=2053492 RepID=UPI00287A827C